MNNPNDILYFSQYRQNNSSPTDAYFHSLFKTSLAIVKRDNYENSWHKYIHYTEDKTTQYIGVKELIKF
jgi:hypothetical protein